MLLQAAVNKQKRTFLHLNAPDGGAPDVFAAAAEKHLATDRSERWPETWCHAHRLRRIKAASRQWQDIQPEPLWYSSFEDAFPHRSTPAGFYIPDCISEYFSYPFVQQITQLAFVHHEMFTSFSFSNSSIVPSPFQSENKKMMSESINFSHSWHMEPLLNPFTCREAFCVKRDNVVAHPCSRHSLSARVLRQFRPSRCPAHASSSQWPPTTACAHLNRPLLPPQWSQL